MPANLSEEACLPAAESMCPVQMLSRCCRQGWQLSGRHSLFSIDMRFCKLLWAFIHGIFSEKRTPNSLKHSYVHYSLSSRVNAITRMHIHYSRRLVLANAPPFTCMLVTVNPGANHGKLTDKLI